MGDFNLPDLCWKYNTAERKQSRRFLERVKAACTPMLRNKRQSSPTSWHSFTIKEPVPRATRNEELWLCEDRYMSVCMGTCDISRSLHNSQPRVVMYEPRSCSGHCVPGTTRDDNWKTF